MVDVGGHDEVDALEPRPDVREPVEAGGPREGPAAVGQGVPVGVPGHGAERGQHPGPAVGAGGAAEPDDDRCDGPCPAAAAMSSPTPRLVADAAVRGVRSSTRCRPQADADSR